MNQTDRSEKKQPMWFMALFALAVAGGATAYVPLLTVLLPLKVAELSVAHEVEDLAQVTFFGAIVASIANIAFGWLSDRSKTRMPWIMAGMVISSVLLIAIGRANSLMELVVIVMIWQVGLNMMLGPLFAWAGDCVPHNQKGVLGGLFALAPAMGALAASLVTFESAVDESNRLSVVAVFVVLSVLPILVFGRGRERAELITPEPETVRANDDGLQSRSTVIRMWIARFLVQISEAGLFAFSLFWLRSLAEDLHENSAANMFSIILVIAVPLSLAIGRWSDRHSRPIAPLVASAGLSALGLLVMAVSMDLTFAVIGYFVFGIAATIFLSLHSGQTLRVLPKPQNRGRDLGVFNLTNTMPSLVMPWLTLALVPSFGFSALFALFAGLAFLAAWVLASAPIARVKA